MRDRPGRVRELDPIWEQVVVDAHDPVALGRWRAEALTSVPSIKPQKSNVSFPSVLGGPMSGSVTCHGWYSPTLKAMSSASLVDGFGPILRSR